MAEAFVFPWSYAGTPTTPPGAPPNWYRLHLSDDLGSDINPSSQVETPDGWVLPIDAVGKAVKVKLPDTSYVFGAQTLVQQNDGWYKVLSAEPIAAVDVRPQTGIPSNLVGIGVYYRPEASETVSGMPVEEYVDSVPYAGKQTVGPTWSPAPDPGDPHLATNEIVFAQQFTAAEVTEIQNLLSGGGGSGGGNSTLSYQNVGTLTLTRGMPVHSSSSGLGRAAQGTTGLKDVVGLYNDVVVLPNGSVGNVLVDGEISQSAADWQLVTNESGGLVVGDTYYLNFTTAGRLSRVQNIDGAPTGSYLVAVGYALTSTTMKLEIQSPIRVA